MRVEIFVLALAAVTAVHGTPVPEVMGYSTLEPGFSTTIDYDLADFDEFGIDPGAADTVNFATDVGQGLELGYPNTGLSDYSSFGTGFDPEDMRLTGDALSDEDTDAVEASTDDGTLDTQGITQAPDDNDNQDDMMSTTPDVGNQDDISSTVSTLSSTIDSRLMNEMTTADSIANNSKSDVLNHNMQTSSVAKKRLSDEDKSSADQLKTDFAEMTSAESFMSANNIDLSVSYRTNDSRSFSGNKEGQTMSSKNASENNISDSNAETSDIDADINDQSDISSTVDGTSNTNSLAESGSGSEMSLTQSTGLTASEDGKTGAYPAQSDQNPAENSERNTLSETDCSHRHNSDDSGNSNTTEDDKDSTQTNSADDTEQSSATSDNTADERRTSETTRLQNCFGEEAVTSNVCNTATSLHTICMYQFSNECNQGQKKLNDLSSATAESVERSGKSSKDGADISLTAQSLESISTSSGGTKGILEVMNLIRDVCPRLCKLASTAVLLSDKHVTNVQHNDTNDMSHQRSNNDTSAEDSFDNDVSADDIDDDDVNDGNASESIDADYSAVDISSGGKSDVSYQLDSGISGPTIVPADGFYRSVQKESGVSGNSDTVNQSNGSE